MFQRLSHNFRASLRTLTTNPLPELSGSLGDLGTLLPLLLSLSLRSSICLPSTLIFSGLFNILSGLVFNIPLPVQPMKAIASASLLQPPTPVPVTTAAGIWVSAAVGLLSVTGTLRVLGDKVPKEVVKGIQTGAGVRLAISGGDMVMKGGSEWGKVMAGAGFVGLVVSQRRERFPFALVLVAVGVALEFFAAGSLGAASAGGGIPGRESTKGSLVEFIKPELGSTKAMGMAVAQVPLTVLNSVVAVAALAEDLGLGEVRITELGLSVASMNLLGGWFGAMPVCHGSGGLAGQYRFGARSGGSVIVLGFVKIGLGIVFGNGLLEFLKGFPMPLLGVMVFAAGMELAWAGRIMVKDGDKEGWMVMMMTAAGMLAFKNDAIGFLAGMMCWWSYRVSDWFQRRSSSVEEAERRGLLR